MITDCTITNNTCNKNGGGLFLVDSRPQITNCRISGNDVNGHAFQDGGGGIHCHTSTRPNILNCLITGNTASQGAGINGFHCDRVAITNCTLVDNNDNNAAMTGGGIRFFAPQETPVILNTILWSNHAAAGPEIWLGGSADTYTLRIDYSDVEGGLSSVYACSNCTIEWGHGMIDDDPIFVSTELSLDDFYLSQIAAGQTQNSPCLDTGGPDAPLLFGTTRTDFVQDAGIRDMGYHSPLF